MITIPDEAMLHVSIHSKASQVDQSKFGMQSLQSNTVQNELLACDAHQTVQNIIESCDLHQGPDLTGRRKTNKIADTGNCLRLKCGKK